MTLGLRILELGQTRVRARGLDMLSVLKRVCVCVRRPRGVIFSMRKVAASDFIWCTTEVAALENKNILTKWLCWFGVM